MIRRILRRAVRYAYTFLGQKEAFLYRLIDTLIESMGEAYPELVHQRELIMKVTKEEEDSFLRTLETVSVCWKMQLPLPGKMEIGNFRFGSIHTLRHLRFPPRPYRAYP